MTDILGSYQAYHKWLDENDHDSTLPNLGLNSNQLFFLSFAQVRQLKSMASPFVLVELISCDVFFWTVAFVVCLIFKKLFTFSLASDIHVICYCIMHVQIRDCFCL